MSRWRTCCRRCASCSPSSCSKRASPPLALREFETSLRSFPNRYRSFAGAAQAAERVGARALARSYHERLLVLTGSADTERPEIMAARRFVARD